MKQRVIKSKEMKTWDDNTRNFQENAERVMVGRVVMKVEVGLVDRDFAITLDNGAVIRFKCDWYQYPQESIETELEIDIELPSQQKQ